MKTATISLLLSTPFLTTGLTRDEPLQLKYKQSEHYPRSLEEHSNLYASSTETSCKATTDDYVAATTLSAWEYALDICGLSSHHLAFGACTRISTGVKEENYQTSAHSYSYYNKQYFTFRTCTQEKKSNTHFWEKNGEMCSLAEHVMSVSDFFYATSGCISNYCSLCSAACGSDEDGSGGDGQEKESDSSGMDCDYCTTSCYNYEILSASGNNKNRNKDYKGCSEADDSSGNTYYYGPQCTEKGAVKMGFFFDDACELKIKNDVDITLLQVDMNFDIFEFVLSVCSDCSDTSLCETVYDSSYHCLSNNGTFVAQGESILQEYEYTSSQDYDDDNIQPADELCIKTFKAEQIIYHHNHKITKSSKGDVLKVIGFIIGTLLLLGVIGFGFISYTYYVRHCVDWGDSSLMCWSEGCSTVGCGSTSPVDEDDVVVKDGYLS